MKVVIETLLPRLIIGRAVDPKVIDHGSKSALLTNLPMRMRGYARWHEPALRVMVLVDQDKDDCFELKSKLETAAVSAGLPTKTAPDADNRFIVVNRIVVEELEAWFLGDVPALAEAFPGLPITLGNRSRFRDPDAVTGGTWEALLRVLSKAGYYVGSSRLPKIDVARRVAPLMEPTRNRSRSFQAFLSALHALLDIEHR